MKYIVIILCIFCLATIITVFALWPEQQSIPQDTVVIINGQPLTRTTIQEYNKDRETHHGGDDDFVSEIITKQLLIAEAQHRGIDREAEFRTALKTFYEHSLIKVLMERVESEISVKVGEDEVNRYLQNFGKTFTFYSYNSPDDASADEIKAKGARYIQLFDDLADNLQRKISTLNPGEVGTFFLTGNDRQNIYLESVEGENNTPGHIDTDMIRENLRQAKVETEINSWIDDLRKQATITYTSNQE